MVDLITIFLTADIRTATPLLLAALGLVFSERAGIVNIGTEGIMLIGALLGCVGASFSGSSLVGALTAIFGGLVMSLIFAFFTITLPLLTPTIFFNLIMQMINAFKEFNAPFLITKGGPLNSTYLYGMMVYENAFQHSKMGYASAQSWVLFMIILVFTALTFKSSPYWTFYEDGGEF